MNIKNAKRRLLDSDEGLSYSQRIAIVDLLDSQQQTIEKLKADRLDFEAIKGLMAFWKEQDSSGHYDMLRDLDEIVSPHVKDIDSREREEN